MIWPVECILELTGRPCFLPAHNSACLQERLKQQQYLRQQFIQQQQEERQRAAQLPMPAEPGQPEMQMQGQAEMPLQDSWGRPEQKSFDATSARQASGAAPSPDKSQLLHSAPTRYDC